MKKSILSAFAFLMLVGAAAGLNLSFVGTAQAASSAEEEGDGPSFFELDPLVLPILDNNGVNQTVSLVIALEVLDAAALAKVQRLQPRLKDAYIQDMYGMLGRHAAMKGGVLQVGMIKKRLNKISTKVLGEDVVEDVLLQVVQQRAI